ncbi:hypothetical protein JCM17380_45640 [Desulfosporosinus burensis]
MITATVHSLEGVICRLGLDPLTVKRFMEEWLQTAHEVSFSPNGSFKEQPYEYYGK